MGNKSASRVILGICAAGAALLVLGCGSAAGNETYRYNATPTPGPEAQETIDLLVGSWGVQESGQPHVTFESDGAASLNDGCNGSTATYAADAEGADVKPVGWTKKACQGVDTWLNGISRVEVSGDELIVLDKGGEEIGRLTR